jgi:hypothetical protein
LPFEEDIVPAFGAVAFEVFVLVEGIAPDPFSSFPRPDGFAVLVGNGIARFHAHEAVAVVKLAVNPKASRTRATMGARMPRA